MWGTRVLAAKWPSQFLLSGHDEMQVTDPATMVVSGRVIGFALLLIALTAVLSGILPSLRAGRANVADRIREGSGGTRRAPGGVLGLDGRAALVGAQVGLALVLLVGAGLVGGSVARLVDVEEGFDTRGLLTLSYSIPATRAAAGNPTLFHDAFLARVASLPGVQGVTTGCPPLAGHCWTTRVDAIEGEAEIPQGEGPIIAVNMVGDRHASTLGIPLLKGRELDERDGRDDVSAIVLSRLAAERLFPSQDPIGRRLTVVYEGEVVGVVGDVLYGRPDQELLPEAYFSRRDYPEASITLIVRVDGEPLDALPAIRSEMASLDPTLAIFGVSTMDELMAHSLGGRSVVLALLALFAGVTLLVAATGTWGIVAYQVADRRRELGLRMALGAGRGSVLGLVLRQSARTAALGTAVGLATAWAGSRLLDALLYETRPTDPLAYLGSSALLLAVVMLASWLPARRATRVDPVEALRSE
jgi:putative ABC transport system permease protein